jgi:hypothetical protein
MMQARIIMTRERATLIGYATLTICAMCGWLYFLGHLTWQLGTWVLS